MSVANESVIFINIFSNHAERNVALRMAIRGRLGGARNGPAFCFCDTFEYRRSNSSYRAKATAWSPPAARSSPAST
jgi:hypothetical protein